MRDMPRGYDVASRRPRFYRKTCFQRRVQRQVQEVQVRGGGVQSPSGTVQDVTVQPDEAQLSEA